MNQVKISRLSGLMSLIIFGLTTVISCTGVDYGYIDHGFGAPEGFGKSVVVPGFDWQYATDSQETQLPDTMNVLLARKVDEIHYAWVVNKDCVPHKATEQFRPLVSKGEYGVLAFYVPKESYTVRDVADFENDLRIPITGYSASLKSVPTKEISDMCGTFASDFATEYKVVREAEPVWRASNMDFVVSDTLHNITLTPENLTLTLNFILRVRLEANAEIKAITGMFTGVPSGLNLMYGTVSASSKAKVVFKMDRQSGASSNAVYSGQVKTLGVLPIGDSSFAVGNCVLYLAIDTQVAGQSRRLYTTVNLRSLIKGQAVMEPENNGFEYRLVRKELGIAVPGQLTINGDRILSGSGSVIEWN